MRSRVLIVASTLAAALICGGFALRHEWSWRSATAGSPWHGAQKPSRVGGRRLFDDVRQHVTQDYVDALTAAQIDRTAAEGMLYELRDPRTKLVPRRLVETDPRDTVRRGSRRAAAARGVLLERGIAYLDAPVFGDSSGRALNHAIDSLRAQGMRTLLLDLRHNATASLDRGVAVAELFLRPGETVVTVRGRGPGATRVISDRRPAHWPGLGVVLLIDSSTARGSEVVAGALQDHDRALLVGTPSSGNGGDAELIPVDGDALWLTTARWYTPSGRRIDRTDSRWTDADTDDEEANGDAADSTTGESTQASRYRTDAGRVLRAGHAITPDVLVSDTAAAAGARTPPAAPATRHDLRADPVIRAALDLATRAPSASDLVLHVARPAGEGDSSSRGPTSP